MKFYKRKIRKNKVQSNNITHIYSQHNKKIENQGEIANVMNKYFCEERPEVKKLHNLQIKD